MSSAAIQLDAQVTDSSSPNHVFGQFADGSFSDGTFYRSTMMVSSDSLNPIVCTATLFGLSVQGFGNGNSRTFTVASGGWNIYRSPGLQNYDGGFVTLNCNGSVTAQVLYALHSSSGTFFPRHPYFRRRRRVTRSFSPTNAMALSPASLWPTMVILGVASLFVPIPRHDTEDPGS